MKKVLGRLVFTVVFLIPVAWYLFLQGFGDNSFRLEIIDSLNADCSITSISILRNMDSLSLAQSNHYRRISFGANEKSIPIVTDAKTISDCINQNTSELVLISDCCIWGFYDLSREGVDQLLTELDILLIQEHYGKDVSR